MSSRTAFRVEEGIRTAALLPHFLTTAFMAGPFPAAIVAGLIERVNIVDTTVSERRM